MSWGFRQSTGPFANLETGKLSEAASGIDPRTEKPAFDFGLSWTNRLIAFSFCVVAGFAVGFMGAVFAVVGQTTIFAILYVVGICISLTGTGFLLTFSRQFKQMFSPVRLTASLLLLALIALTYIFAFVVPIDVLVLLCALGSFLAYLWYALSYIPFARAVVKKMSGGILG